jgi:hypothetical protein
MGKFENDVEITKAGSQGSKCRKIGRLISKANRATFGRPGTKFDNRIFAAVSK